VATRRLEQTAAARALGANGEVVFLGEIDGELESTRALRGEVARWIRALRPAVVLGHDPWKRYRLHPDHRHAGLLACEGIVAARDPHFFREHGLPPHRPSELLLWEADEPDHAEDVGMFVDRKLDGLFAHESQFESTMHALDDDELEAFATRVRTRLTEQGSPLDLPAAEIFKRISRL
jgi:LmbE family N-acetylglucosaminyl deacetylase